MSEPNIGPESFDLRSPDLAIENTEKLLRLFPAARAEGGGVDIAKLRLELGDLESTERETYGVSWAGKKACFKNVQAPSIGTLRPLMDQSITFDDSSNLIIEGDNLETLKLLQKSYQGKVKMIYIDPPYNTGNDFVYPDDYAENLQTYLRYTGQVDDEGRKFSTNTDTAGRYHSRWLNMMYPRLHLARNLLRDDGVLFISIDDNELSSLRFLCDDIFGEENRVEVFSWVRTTTPAALSVKTKKMVEYVLCYERQRNNEPYRGIEKPVQSSNSLLNQPNPVGELLFPARSVTTKLPDGVIQAGLYGTSNYEIELLEDATVAEGVFTSPVHLKAKFRWSQKYLAEQLASGVRVSIATKSMVPSYEKESYGRGAPPNLIDRNVGVGTNEQATAELKKLFSDAPGEFITDMRPKPVSLLRYLIGAVCDGADIVMDFFAGSGTTAHAVLDLNNEDGGKRKFILVQLPEPTDRDDYPTIADLTKERVRRVISKLNEEDASKLEVGGTATQDRGFRVFKLAESNFTTWDAAASKDEDALAEQLEMHIDHIREGRSEDDLLYELLSKSGFPLTTKVEEITCADATVHSVADGALLICLERKLSLEAIRAMAELRPERVVCLDEGFLNNDQLKANAAQIFKTKNVPSFKTV